MILQTGLLHKKVNGTALLVQQLNKIPVYGTEKETLGHPSIKTIKVS